jgi:uncharacterized protein (TIGR02246 family)
MDVESERIVSPIVTELEKAWNAGDGAAFARPFTEDADFVNIRGEHIRTRDVIAKGHQSIFNTIYTGSSVRLQLAGVRTIVPGCLLAHVKSILHAPTGPLTGEHHALFSMVVIPDGNDWRITAFHNTLSD